jgi:hypothetical protein
LGRVRTALRILAPAMIFLAVRQIGLLVLDWMVIRNHTSAGGALTSWDGMWYLGIASHGYDNIPDGLYDAFGRRLPDTPMAFFPGYPYAVHTLGDLPGIGLVAAAFSVSVIAGMVCAYGLTRLGERISGGSRRAGLILVALFAASPMAIALSMAYSEALFCALAVWALVFVLERNWVAAGSLCALAGLVRPTAAALVLAVGLAAAVAVFRRGERPWRRVLAATGALIAPVGLVGYLAFVAVRTGRWDGWFYLQRRGWDSRFDGGAATWKFSLDVLASARSVLEVATVGFVLVALGLVVVCVQRRVAWPLVVYALGVLAMDLCSNGLMNSKARLMLPAFTLLIPLAIALAKRRTPTVVLTLGAAALASAWFGAYSITAWPYAI